MINASSINSTKPNVQGESLDPPAVVQSIAVFLLAGLFEIGGGWLVWGWLREGRVLWIGLLGCAVLAAYGAVATLQASKDQRMRNQIIE